MLRLEQYSMGRHVRRISQVKNFYQLIVIFDPVILVTVTACTYQIGAL